jgi:hypothetical protein
MIIRTQNIATMQNLKKIVIDGTFLIAISKIESTKKKFQVR